MKRFALLVTGALLAASAAHAAIPTSRARVLLLECPTPESLRARLAAYADSAQAGDAYGAGEAHWLIGSSHDRGGDRDSAILHYRRAVELRGAREEVLALADALFLRRADGDARAAVDLLAPLLAQSQLEPPAVGAALRGRLAWATFLAGDKDSAFALFEPVEERLSMLSSEWRYRMGRVAHERGDRRRAVALLLPVVVRSRGTDQDAVTLLEAAGEPLGQRLDGEITRSLAARDRAEGAVLDSMGARRIRFASPDGFPLSGALLEAEGAGPHRVAVVLVAPADSIGAYDSLAVALRRSGLHVLLMDPRGSGWAVAPTCPLPDAWSGREQAMQTRVARDVREGVRAVALVAPSDTSRVLVAAAGTLAGVAVEAAALDPRVAALVLAAPTPPLVDRGVTAARLGARKVPVFFQVSPEDWMASGEITEGLYATSAARAASRVSQSRMPGRGVESFRNDPDVRARFTTWLAETLAPRATPKAARRRG